jgi:hypothetical protein
LALKAEKDIKFLLKICLFSFMSSLTSTCSSWAKRRLDFATREALITAKEQKNENKCKKYCYLSFKKSKVELENPDF